jgi:methylmalonyl-CoA mutase
MAESERPQTPALMADLAAWRRLVEERLQGRDFSALTSRTRDDIAIEPLYAARHDRRALPGRGASAWRIVQFVDDPDVERANGQALEDLAGGATGLSLRFADAAAGEDGLPPDEQALRIALDAIDLAAIHVRVNPHRRADASAIWLRDLVLRQGIAPERADVAYGLDPVALFASRKAVELDPHTWTGTFQLLAAGGFGGAYVALDARRYHEAGASEAQELAAILATAVWWLRALDPLGFAPEAAFARFDASVAADRDQFLSIAKLRALRLLWTRLGEVCGVAPTHLPVHAETSRRMMTRAEPHTNILRTTIAVFAAAVGGADSIAVVPHDAALGLSGREARTLARNVHHLLVEETQLHRVSDSGAGSGIVEALTDALAERAWHEFQTIEREGGIVESLRSGLFQKRIADARSALAAQVVSGAAPLVGATIHRQSRDQDGATEKASAASAEVGLTPMQLEEQAGRAA